MKKLIIICLLFLLVGCNKTDNETKIPENKIQYNNKDTVITEKNLDDISFTTTSFYYDGEYSVLVLTITNNKEKTINIGYFDIIIKDENNNEVGRYFGNCSSDIISGSSIDMEISLDQNFIDGSSIEYVLNNLEVK